MVVTLPGIEMEVRLRQPEKAPSSMDVTLLGMEIEVRPKQLTKAHEPIDATLLGITKSFISVPFKNKCLA